MQLLQHFKDLTLHPKNAKELKGLILQLAVQGKLTKNWRKKNTYEITPKEFLQIIQKGKSIILKESEVKNEKPIERFDKSDEKFSLPKSWFWTRFASVAYICRGGSPRPIANYITENLDGINWIKIGDTKGVLKYIETTKEKILPEGLKMSRLVKPGDFILSNSMSFGKPYLMKTTGCIHDGWLLIREVEAALDKDFLYHMLSSPYVYSSFKESAAGGVVQNLNIEKVRQTLIPIPPIEEQREIVRVVEILFKEVEQLEQLTKDRIALKEDFVTSALRQLTTANTETEWNYLQNHFKSFFTEKDSIKKLREAVLQLAVQGKLTVDWRKKNPDTEPATELLKIIQKEKTQLIKDKKIKKESPLPLISNEEIPYELPESWVWCRLEDILHSSFYGPRFGKEEYVENGVPTIRTTDMDSKGFIKLKNPPKIKLTEEKLNLYKVERGDLLVTRTGSIGTMAIFNEEYDAIPSAYLIRFRFLTVKIEYIFNLMHSPYGQQSLGLLTNVVAQPNINATSIRNIPFPLPPITEQKAIVEKVNALIFLCDQLEQEIEESKTLKEQFMKSALREVFESKSEKENA